jgi:hypothetical protein
MDTEARRDEIQRRLKDLQRERTIEERGVSQLSRVVGGVEVVVRVGDRVRITDDSAIFDASERDPLKKMYIGEDGEVTLTLSDYLNRGEAVEVKFIDGCKHTYSLNCIEGFVGKPERGKSFSAPTKASHVNVNAGATTDAPLPQEQALAAPSWSSLRQHASLRSVATAKQPPRG